MALEFIRSPRPRRALCWGCARLEVRDIRVARRRQVSYFCSFRPRGQDKDRCEFFIREPGTDDDLQPKGRWRVAGTAH